MKDMTTQDYRDTVHSTGNGGAPSPCQAPGQGRVRGRDAPPPSGAGFRFFVRRRQKTECDVAACF